MCNTPFPAETIFNQALLKPEILEKVFVGYGPIPSVTFQLRLRGNGMEEGMRRLVFLSDGSQAMEEIVKLDIPHTFQYRNVWHSFPYSLLIKTSDGTWSFSPDPQGTKVVWHYSFELSNVLAYPFVFLLIQLFFKKFMMACFEANKKLLAEFNIKTDR